jgi:rhodanese-related sulfurtransferase
MGFTVYLCVEELDFTIIANTQYFLRVVTPKGFYLGRSQKNGPRKSPDFVALDSQGRVNVLECKGTQQSRKALQTLIESGVQQKSNLKTRAGSAVHHSLVVGLFVPQFSNQEEALLHVRDPQLPLVEDILKRITVAQQTIGITQIALAQHFGLMGLQSMANALANRAMIENEPLQLEHGLEAEAVQAGQDPTYTFRFSLPLPTGAMTLNTVKSLP